MTMMSCELVVDFATPLSFCPSTRTDKNRLHIDLTWVEPIALIGHFNLQPKPGEDQGLLWLEGAIELSALLAYHGHNLSDAAERFSDLADQLEWRQEHRDDSYLDAQQLEAFYLELQAGNRPLEITLAFIEHY
jgi:hypothetical protein